MKTYHPLHLNHSSNLGKQYRCYHQVNEKRMIKPKHKHNTTALHVYHDFLKISLPLLQMYDVN